MTKHIMVDLETLGTGPNAAVLSIGMVMFDDTSDTFVPIDSYSGKVRAQTITGDIDADVVMWWMGQSDAARDAITSDADAFSESIIVGSAHKMLALNDDALLWGNGAAFDNVILRSLFARNIMSWPLKYSSDRCYRTMKAMFPQVPAPEFAGIKHHAYDDAMHQAKHLYDILQHLK